MSKKLIQDSGKNKYAEMVKNAPPKEKNTAPPSEFQPHNAKKEGLGPNTNR